MELLKDDSRSYSTMSGDYMEGSEDSFSDLSEKKGLNFFLAALALLSTMIGGGIVGIPYAFYLTGFPLGIIMNIICAALTSLSCLLYIQTIHLMKGTDSLSMIGYKLIGRPFIFMMSIILMLLCMGAMIIYFNIFGTIASSLVQDLTHNTTSFFTNEPFYIIVMGVLNLYPVLKKSIKELKIVSVILSISVATFLIILIVWVCIDGFQNPDPDYKPYWFFKFNLGTVNAFSIFIFAYSF
jgi:amino acid permease